MAFAYDRVMSAHPLMDALPELVVQLRRDGSVVSWGGGRGVGNLRPGPEATGSELKAEWPPAVVTTIKQLLRKTLATRAATEARFEVEGTAYEARATAQGPDSVLVVIRTTLVSAPEDSLETTDERPRPQLDRRGFLRRFKESAAVAALRESQMAIAVLHIDGLSDIGQIIGSEIAERAMSVAIMRLPLQQHEKLPQWYLGQLGESLLAVVLESADREAIEECIGALCTSLREPVAIGSAEFHLTPFAGVAILGQDSGSPRTLLEQARAAATDARRAGVSRPRFFTDTLKLRSLARLDIARELSEAISNQEIGLRYIGRHDLTSGDLVTWAGYLRWLHPLRGEIRAADFLGIAETTGLAVRLSRAALASLRQDFVAHSASWSPQVRMSFGPLRHHILHKDFVEDIANFVAEGVVPAQRLEIRIAEKTFITRPPAEFAALADLGVRLVVDEVGRGMASLDWLARASIWGLQLDRAWVTAFRSEPAALKVCSAGIAVATALALTPIATGVDEPTVRDALLKLGCRQGAGDLFSATFPDTDSALAPPSNAAGI